MKFGVSVSAVAHAVLILWGLLVFPSAEVLQTQELPALPVDLVSITDVTKLSAGETKSEEKKPPAVRKIEAPEKAEETPKEAAKPEAKPEPKPEAKPEPKPEPVAKPEPAPKPEPVKEAAPEPEPAPEAKPEEPKLLANAPLPERRPKVQPQARPQRPAEPEKPKPQTFDPDRISALLNKQPEPTGGASAEQNTEQTAALGANEGTADSLSLSDIDALRQQISRCYNPPLAVIEAQGLTVKLNVGLSEDGSVQSGPRLMNSSGDPLFQLAAEAAMRAVTGCQPYTLPPEKYHLWRDITMNFDPRDMLR
ncbi:MAG: hypothetical protein AB7O39_12025 [Flavobacteriaceae bacterium]